MTATGDSRGEGRFERGDTVDESGGRGQPRSGNSEADERRIVPSRSDGADAPSERTAPPAGSGDDAPLANGDRAGLAPERPDPNVPDSAEPDPHAQPAHPSGPSAPTSPPAPSTRPAPSDPAAPSVPSSHSGAETPSNATAAQTGRDTTAERPSGGPEDRPVDASATQRSDAAKVQSVDAPASRPNGGAGEGGPDGSGVQATADTAERRNEASAAQHASAPGGRPADGPAGPSRGERPSEPSVVGSAGPWGGTAAERQAGGSGGGGGHAGGAGGSSSGGSAGGPGGQGPQTGPGPGGPGKPPRGPGGGLLMGRPFGVPVYVAPSWFLVAALITWVFAGQLDRVLPELGAARYLASLFFVVAFYASVLVHELAHTVAALRFKLPVRRIQLQFFGGVSEIEKESETPGREFVLAFVGPLLSLVLAGAFYAGMQVVERDTVPGVLLAGLMISNLIVAAFNLLPGLPLDGGRMLRAVIWKITGKPMSGTVAAAWVGRALAISVLVGLPMLTQSGALGSGAEQISGMDTVTDALLAAILAAIIWTGAGNSLRMARLREHLPELRARTLTRRAVPVTTDTPLSEALRRANEAGARALVVVDAHGDPLSVVREAAIVGVPEHRRPWVAVSGLAQELTDGMRVSAELAGEELLDVLRATPATEYLVVEDTGEIYGVLSAADVERAFVKAMARPAS
ncbi:site-2 protease family protein [Streptomyces sp. NPDC002896]|uniref:site-2 protease family protein n=1 Tax=Streptomyces sp. NPDC002896 TaxID=3154438 RepID=UPI00332EBE43